PQTKRRACKEFQFEKVRVKGLLVLVLLYILTLCNVWLVCNPCLQFHCCQMRGGGVVRVLFGLLFLGASAAVGGVDTTFQEGRSLRINPSSVVVRYGDRVTVNCTVSGPHEGIGWEASEGSVPMVQNVQFVTWRLDNITDWNIHPICFGNFLNGTHHTQDQKRLGITLYKTPDSVILNAVNQTGPMLEGKQYLLMCVVKSIAPVQELSVRWYKGKRELVKQTFHDDLTKTPVDVSSSHWIRPTIADDGEQYSCVAELDLGPDGPQPPPLIKSEPLTLTVHGKPRIIDCQDLVELKEGESLDTLVSCRVEGNPNPEVTWYKDQSQFSGSTPLTMRDAGQFVITARNAVGSESVSFTLGYAPIFNCSAKYTVSVNEHFSITCKPEGFPLPKIMLFKEDDYEEVELSAQITDAGEYTIIAWNDFGKANHSLDVEVLYPPSEIVELESEEVDFGAAVVLKCSSQGNPRPWYSWTYHRVPNVQELSFDGISLLKISRASKENDGIYICHAVNQIGQTSKTVTLTLDKQMEIYSPARTHHRGGEMKAKLNNTVGYYAAGR
ncbi:hypothetical protein GJAV_G00220170, partial [Gymnothorax javanicus]